MNVLIVHAHESVDSFSSALAKTASAYFKESGHQVTISNLYEKGFNPVGGKHDFQNISESRYYKYALEQIEAVKNSSFSEDVAIEMKLLESADVLILNFPLWWFGMPAILKGWVDRILAYGFAYGGEYGIYEEGRFHGKKAFLSITTGSPQSFYTKDGAHGRSLENILRNINEGIIGLVGFEVLESYIGYSVSRISQDNREKIIREYVRFLQNNFD